MIEGLLTLAAISALILFIYTIGWCAARFYYKDEIDQLKQDKGKDPAAKRPGRLR